MPTLDHLEVGGRARVIGIEGDPPLVQRLFEMGLIDGEDVTVIGRAPLGDPIEIWVRGYRLSLRTAEAKLICVEVPHDENRTG